MTGRVAATFAPQVGGVHAFGEWLGAALARHHVDASARFELELAAVEAFANIVRHGRPRSPIRVVVRSRTWGAEVELVDDGAACDMTRIATSLPEDPLAPAGRGLFIIRQMTDDFRYRREGECNAHTLVRCMA